MSTQQAHAKALDWIAIAQTERHDMIGELQRHLGLKLAQKNEAMRFLEVHREMLLAAKVKIEDSERDDRREEAAMWREAKRSRERCIRSQHAARASAAAAAHGADATTAAMASGRSETWDKALQLVGALPRPAAGPRSSSVSRAFTETLKKAQEAMDKGLLGAPA